MIRINLLPVRDGEEASSRRRELGLAGALLFVTVAAVGVGYFFQQARLSAVQAELTRQEATIGKIRKQHQEVVKIDQQTKDIEDKIVVVKRLTNPERRSASVHILDDLSASTPNNLWLIEFAENKGQTKISGKAVDNQTIAAFAYKLSNSQYFKKVEIRETAQENLTPGAPGVRRPATGKTAEPEAPLISLTKFLVETQISYLPSDAQAETPGKQENTPEEHGKSAPKTAKQAGSGGQ